jgi:hypothetical protein
MKNLINWIVSVLLTLTVCYIVWQFIIWAYPSCAPGEVWVQGPFGMVCVAGHH